MALSQLFLADTCIRALSSVLWIVAIGIASQILCQDIELWQMLFFPHCKSSLLGNVIPGNLVATGFLEAVTQQHQQQNTLPHNRSKVSPGVCQL